jgi:hypothetical protein
VRWAELDGLAAALAARSIPVAHGVTWWFGERLTLRLDDGSTLRARLLWPCPGTVAAVTGLEWDDRLGWELDVRTTDGVDRSLRAWYVEWRAAPPDRVR